MRAYVSHRRLHPNPKNHVLAMRVFEKFQCLASHLAVLLRLEPTHMSSTVLPSSSSFLPRDTPGLPRDTPGLPRDTPGLPRDTPGLPRDSRIVAVTGCPSICHERVQRRARRS